MSVTFADLLIEQNAIIELMKRVYVNYKKMGKEKFTEAKTRSRLEILEGYWTKIKELHFHMLRVATADDKKESPYFVKGQFLVADEEYMEIRDILSEILHKQVHQLASTKVGDNSSFIHDTHGANSVPMPRINIPTFSGKLTEWETFRDLFESLVAKNDALTNTQRLHYLKSVLVGEASLLINHIKISDANYEGAWKILVAEFDNKRLLVYSHLQAFIELPVMKTENIQEMKLLRDTVSASLSALSNLERPIEYWDDLLVYIISQKFSPRTRNEWNMMLGVSTDVPTYIQIHEFLTLRIRGLTKCNSEVIKGPSVAFKSTKSNISMLNVSVKERCPLCSNSHPLHKCIKFRNQNIEQRYNTVKQIRLCFNCLKSGHIPINCSSLHHCNKCDKPHHTMLHRDKSYNNRKDNNIHNDSLLQGDPNLSSSLPPRANSIHSQQPPRNNQLYSTELSHSNFVAHTDKVTPGPSSTVHSTTIQTTTVILPTAWMSLRTTEGRLFKVRALLDQGSAFSFVSESFAQIMHTKRYPAEQHIIGFGEQYSGSTKSLIRASIEPCNTNGPRFPLNAYVFQKLTAYAATRVQTIGSWAHLQHLHLADPSPDSTHPIHLLIGSDLYGSLLLNDLRQGPLGSPTAQLTVFGWIISGPTGNSLAATSCSTALNCVAMQNVDELLQQFWETEEITPTPCMSEEDQYCEEHFINTHSRTPQGRYIVCLPFRKGPPLDIGNSFNIATKLYHNLEKRLSRNPHVAEEYHKFLTEYEALGHMELVTSDHEFVDTPIYIPHHSVFKNDNISNIRVVFNASCVTDNGTSLNDHLHIGPKLQTDLSAVIMRWRQGYYACSSDITKMFRQILIHPSHADYQRVLWRPDSTGPLLSYRLKTVTYGTAPAPFLAIRVLKQLTLDEGHDYPLAVPVLQFSTYVDDILFSADEISTVLETRKQLSSILSRGGFCLRKWAANCQELIHDIPQTDRELNTDRSLNETDSLKILGIKWIPSEDAFTFQIATQHHSKYTKRTVLSLISKLYDPMGWAAPVVISAKILMQDLWIRKTNWDDVIPDDLLEEWMKYHSSLHQLEKIRIPRWTGQHLSNLGVELHGFADASTRAYSAVVFMRVMQASEVVHISLISAKTKVAPVKTLSIPKLELSAAVLLVKLLDSIQDHLNLKDTPTYGWTDSSVVLAWVKQHPSKWSTFVANRVSYIQTRFPKLRWNHVRSASNPADCASRGITPNELTHHSLWWTGPSWLKQPSRYWPSSQSSLEDISDLTRENIMAELRRPHVCHVRGSLEWDLPNKISTWPWLLRVTAYLIKFVRYLQSLKDQCNLIKSPLTSEDIFEARLFWFRYLQRLAFPNELKALANNQSIPKSSSLRSLNPFIGRDNLIRLGGRIRNSALMYNERFPIIMPQHRLTELLVQQAHLRALHGGTQITLSILRQDFWILNGRNLVKSHIHRCLPCVRDRANPSSQLMGDLPAPRVTQSVPFTHTGLDYAGPMLVTPYVGRGCKARKYYIAIFVCMSIKAIHLEYVDDYATSGFIAAYKRFVSRRGLPSVIYSDNGTNFHGADRELRKAFQSAIKDVPFRKMITNDGTSWRFIPPAAPHFGGLWEAGVRSFKSHLRKVTGNHVLSQLELSTLLCQIEACLNSRPLIPLHDDPNDFAALTPAHFLVGKPLTSVPEPSLLEVKENLLSRWQRVQLMRDRVWHCWQRDYLHSLQQRHKWQRTSTPIKVNELVLLKNNLLPPTKWALARVMEVYPGTDGIVRVVNLRTAETTLKRPITQICRLPIETTASQ